MNAKLFEIRDRATFIPVLAVKLEPLCGADMYLLARSGYGSSAESQSEYVMLIQINGGSGLAKSDPYDWEGSRTYRVAHDYIITNFDKLDAGDVVDVENILGEKVRPAVSEQYE